MNKPYVPGPTANMDMNGQPLAPAAPPATPFAGIQGSGGGAPAATSYTWGGTGERQLATGLPQGAKTYDEAVQQGWYKARDAADGQWLWTQAGQMKPYDTSGAAMQGNGYGTSIPVASANKPK